MAVGVRRGQKDGHGHLRLPHPYLVSWQGVPAVTVSLGCDIGMGWLSLGGLLILRLKGTQSLSPSGDFSMLREVFGVF